MALQMDEDSKRVIITSMGDGSFDPFGMNSSLSHLTTITNASNPSMNVDGQGGQDTKGVIVVKDEDVELGDEINPVATPFGDETQGVGDAT